MNYEKGFVPHAGDVTAICVGEQEFLGRVIDPDLEMVKALGEQEGVSPEVVPQGGEFGF